MNDALVAPTRTNTVHPETKPAVSMVADKWKMVDHATVSGNHIRLKVPDQFEPSRRQRRNGNDRYGHLTSFPILQMVVTIERLLDDTEEENGTIADTFPIITGIIPGERRVRFGLGPTTIQFGMTKVGPGFDLIKEYDGYRIIVEPGPPYSPKIDNRQVSGNSIIRDPSKIRLSWQSACR